LISRVDSALRFNLRQKVKIVRAEAVNFDHRSKFTVPNRSKLSAYKNVKKIVKKIIFITKNHLKVITISLYEIYIKFDKNF